MYKGNLLLIPSSLDDENVTSTLLPELLTILNRLNYFIVENEKSARRFLKLAGLATPQSDLKMLEYSKHNRLHVSEYLKPLFQGNDMGLISEAGCPAVADPGSEIVWEAHKAGIRVVPFVGPSAIILAQMVSGFNGQSFVFHGYLPIDKVARKNKLKQMEADSSRHDQTQIWIETPFRNAAMIDDLLSVLNTSTLLCIAAGLTSSKEFVLSCSIRDWKTKVPELGKIPAVFLLYVPAKSS